MKALHVYEYRHNTLEDKSEHQEKRKRADDGDNYSESSVFRAVETRHIPGGLVLSEF